MIAVVETDYESIDLSRQAVHEASPSRLAGQKGFADICGHYDGPQGVVGVSRRARCHLSR